ncbi:MAG TPA: hypothetical protein VF630_17680 [Hymenobacter sp.]
MKFLVRTLALAAVACLAGFPALAQVGIGTTAPNASAALEVRAANKGLLIPQVTLSATTDGTTISTPATGLLVFNRNAGLGGGVGFYYNAGAPAAPNWTKLNTGAAAPGSGWGLSDNANGYIFL